MKDTLTIGGTQFLPCVVLGQSFLLHQIRKMIGDSNSILLTVFSRQTVFVSPSLTPSVHSV